MAKMFAEIQKLSKSLNNHSKLHKRLPINVLKCGREKVLLDSNKINEISKANSRQNIRKLVKYVFVTRKPTKIHSRSNACPMKKAKRKAIPMAILSETLRRRLRLLRRLLGKYKESRKIDKNRVGVMQFLS